MRKCYFIHSTGESCKAGLSLCTCAPQIKLISKLASLHLNVLAPSICPALISQFSPLLSAGLLTFEHSALLNQGLNILKAWISRTHICSRLILPSKPHGVLNLKPLFRPIHVNLKCFADLEHYNFSEDVSSAPSDTKISLQTDREVQATSSAQQLGWIGSARGCIPGITAGSSGAAFCRAVLGCCREQLQRWGVLRQQGALPQPLLLFLSLCWAGIRGLTLSQHADFHNSEL